MGFLEKYDLNLPIIDFRLYVILGMNGQGIYATWTVIASLLNLSHCLHYIAEIEMETVSSIALGTLLAHIIVYFVIENTILDNYVRLLLTPYFGKYLIYTFHIKNPYGIDEANIYFV